jgi:uncharacterized protein YfiM (DUF2279 family)
MNERQVLKAAAARLRMIGLDSDISLAEQLEKWASAPETRGTKLRDFNSK